LAFSFPCLFSSILPPGPLPLTPSVFSLPSVLLFYVSSLCLCVSASVSFLFIPSVSSPRSPLCMNTGSDHCN
jgi:hypothetical protein